MRDHKAQAMAAMQQQPDKNNNFFSSDTVVLDKRPPTKQVARQSSAGSRQKPIQKPSSHEYEFNPRIANENMEQVIDTSESVEMSDVSQQVKVFDYAQNLTQLQNSSQIKKCRAMEDLMRHLVTIEIGEVGMEINNPRSKFP